MRCTQVIGLSDKARNFLDKHAVYDERLNWTVSEVYENAKHLGMFDDGPMLLKYRLKVDGSYVYEYAQAVPWSSGPCIFLALKRENGEPIPETLWSDEDIEKA